MIYAVSPEGVIGLSGKVPWSHPGDVSRFDRVTRGATVIMGRATFEETGRALADRYNVVVTSRPLRAAGVVVASSVAEAVSLVRTPDMWFIGGARIYEEAAAYVDVIDVTYVPDHVESPRAVKAPPIDPSIFAPGLLLAHEDEPGLSRRVFRRRARAESTPTRARETR